jgi:hypothetical protein
MRIAELIELEQQIDDAKACNTTGAGPPAPGC